MDKGVILEKPSEKLYFVKRRGMKYEPEREGELRKIRKEVRKLADSKVIKKKVSRTNYKQRGLTQKGDVGLAKVLEERNVIAKARGDTFPALENFEQLKEKALTPQEKLALKEKKEKLAEEAELIKQGQLVAPQQNLNLRALVSGLPEKLRLAIIAGLPPMALAGVGIPAGAPAVVPAGPVFAGGPPTPPPAIHASFGTPTVTLATPAIARAQQIKTQNEIDLGRIGDELKRTGRDVSKKDGVTPITDVKLNERVKEEWRKIGRTGNLPVGWREMLKDNMTKPRSRSASPAISFKSASAGSGPATPTKPKTKGKGLSFVGSDPNTWGLKGAGFFKDIFNKAKDAVLSDPVGAIKKAYEIGKKGVDITKKLKGVDIKNNPIGALHVLSGIGGALPKAHRKRFHDNCRGEFDRIHGAGFFDKLKEGLGIFTSGIAAPFRLASKINPMFGFGVDKIADAVGVPTISSTLGAGLDAHGGGIIDSWNGLKNAPAMFRRAVTENPSGASMLFGTLFKHFMAGGDLKMAKKVKRHFKKEMDAVHGAGFFSSLLKKAVSAGINKVVEKVKSDPLGSLKQAIDVGKQGVEVGKQLLGKTSGGGLASTIRVV